MALIDVIKYEGSRDILIYRYPNTEFNTMSQLVVHESQEAVFFKNGRMLDVFRPGKYTLHTKNIPLLNKVINLPFGGESPFQCEVYFVNKAIALNYKWGTMSKTRVMDNKFHILLEIGACGTLGLRVVNPRELLWKIVGTESELTAEACLNFFRENVSAKVKEYLANVMRDPKMDFLALELHLHDFSLAVKERLQETFNDVGVELYNFIIGTINIPDDQYQVIMQGQQELQKAQYGKQLKSMEAEGDAKAATIRADGRAKSRQIEGYNWADEQLAETSKLYAGNPGSAQNPMNMLAQAPVALTLGDMIRENMEPVAKAHFSNGPMSLRKAVSGNGEKYHEPAAEEQTVHAGEDPVKILAKLKEMLDLGLIPKEMYDEKMKEVLSRM